MNPNWDLLEVMGNLAWVVLLAYALGREIDQGRRWREVFPLGVLVMFAFAWLVLMTVKLLIVHTLNLNGVGE